MYVLRTYKLVPRKLHWSSLFVYRLDTEMEVSTRNGPRNPKGKRPLVFGASKKGAATESIAYIDEASVCT